MQVLLDWSETLEQEISVLSFMWSMMIFLKLFMPPPEQEPVEWKELILFQKYRNDLDDDTYVPQLADEWLSPDELKSCQIEQLERRERGDNKLPPQLNLPNQDQNQDSPSSYIS